MIPSIPISFLLFTSTKGHYDFKDIYLTTLSHYDRQVPLSQFAVKVAHIKVTPGEEGIAKMMEDNLVARGFKVLTTTAAWTRGANHGQEYMKDVIKVSKEPSIHRCPHVMWVEDDTILLCHKDPLDRVLSRMTHAIDSSPDHLSARFIWRSAYEGGVPSLQTNADSFYSPFTDFQPALWRARDFYLAAKTMEDNWDRVHGMHCEALWRAVTDPLSRSTLKHLVWLPDYAEPIHLGCPEYPDLKQRYC
jgi:hypothetical protein